MSLSTRLFSEAFRDMQRAMSAFEHPALNSVGPLLGTSLGETIRYPAADLVETKDGYELHADLPGYDKNNIKIELPDSQTLILSGSVNETRTSGNEEPQQEEEKKDDKKNQSSSTEVAKKDNNNQVGQHNPPSHFWVKERVSGAFSRTFRFPTPVKSDNIKASFKDGTLKVVVPKATEEQPKQISID